MWMVNSLWTVSLTRDLLTLYVLLTISTGANNLCSGSNWRHYCTNTADNSCWTLQRDYNNDNMSRWFSAKWCPLMTHAEQWTKWWVLFVFSEKKACFYLSWTLQALIRFSAREQPATSDAENLPELLMFQLSAHNWSADRKSLQLLH